MFWFVLHCRLMAHHLQRSGIMFCQGDSGCHTLCPVVSANDLSHQFYCEETLLSRKL